MRGENRGDRTRDLVLNCEDIFQLSIVALGPTVGACSSINQLRRDANPITTAANAALEHVAHAKFTAHLAHIYCLTLVLEA